MIGRRSSGGFCVGAIALSWAWMLGSASLVGAGVDAAAIARGEKVYAEKKCAVCHSINGAGGKSGGDLSTAGAARDADWLKRFIKAPKSVMPNAKMPAFKGGEPELDAVVAYMTSLK